MTDREMILYPIVCLACGFDGDKPIKARNGVPAVDICKCPKCSKTAYVLSPLRTRFLMQAMAKEIVRLKMDMMDMQGFAEEIEQARGVPGGASQ